MKQYKLHIFVLSLLFATLFFASVTATSTFASSADSDNTLLITTQEAFQDALRIAQVGDEIIVEDIDFSWE